MDPKQCFIIIIVWLSFVCKELVGFVWHCFAYACLALHCLTLHRESKNYVIFSCCCIVFLLPRLVPVRYFGLSAIFFTASKTALLQGATTSPATEQTPVLLQSRRQVVFKPCHGTAGIRKPGNGSLTPLAAFDSMRMADRNSHCASKHANPFKEIRLLKISR